MLRKCGVDNVIRVAVGDVVIYEDSENIPNDFGMAMETLQRKASEGLNLEYLDQFDLILEHDDGILSYVIDFDIFREHQRGVDPIVIHITALSAELKRHSEESPEEFKARTAGRFASQRESNRFRQKLAGHFGKFLTKIREGLQRQLVVDDIRVVTSTRVVKKSAADQISVHTGYGDPFYGYDPVTDLYYMDTWHDQMAVHALSMNNFVYVEPGGEVLTEVASEPWTAENFDQFGEASVAESTDGGGGSIDTDGTKSDSGGGGWLDSVGDFFSDSGGGGDVGGDSGGDSGGSSCGSCGGGGCGGE